MAKASPGPPGGHRGQTGAAGPEGGGRALWGCQHFWQFLQKQNKVPGLHLPAGEHQPLRRLLPLPNPTPHCIFVDSVRPSRPDPLDHLKVCDGIPLAYDMKQQWFLRPPRQCVGTYTEVGRLHGGWPTWASWLMRYSGGEGEGEGQDPLWEERQLAKMQKQAKQKVGKKTDRYTEVLNGLLVWAQQNWLLLPKTTTTEHQANERVYKKGGTEGLWHPKSSIA